MSYCFFVQSLMMIPIPTTTTKERLAPCPTSTRRSPARNSYFVVTGASFFIDSVGTGEIRKGPLTFGERIRRRVGWLLSRYSPVWAWREMKASDARRNGWPVVTEIQVNANGTEQNRAERVADVSAALVLLSFDRVHYGEWLYCFFRSMERKQASERSGVASGKVKVSFVIAYRIRYLF